MSSTRLAGATQRLEVRRRLTCGDGWAIAITMQMGILSLGDHLADPTTGKRGNQAQKHRLLVDTAVRAEALGFDSIWLGEHHFCDYIVSSPLLLLAAMAERTQRLRLGTAVTLLPIADPVRIAEEFATVDLLSSGRVEMVVGRGILRNVYPAFGCNPDKSRSAYEEKLRLLLRLWGDEPVTWSGEHRAPLNDVVVQPRPLQQPHPPVWLGTGSSRASIDLAAELGLPLMLPSVLIASKSFVPYLRRYRERYEAAGHDMSKLRVCGSSHVHVAANSQDAKRRWRPYHMRYIEWVTHELLPWGRANFQVTGNPLQPDYDSLLEGAAICGSPAEVTDRLLAMQEQLGLSGHVSMFDHGGIPEQLLDNCMELFAAQVIPKLKQT